MPPTWRAKVEYSAYLLWLPQNCLASTTFFLRFGFSFQSDRVPHGRLPFVMPDNTWFNPYKLSYLKCLSSGPSQGIVHELDDSSVIKVPFQYPVGDGSTTDEKTDHLVLSLKIFNYFKQECRIYELLSKSPHLNMVTRFQCKKQFRNNNLWHQEDTNIAQGWRQESFSAY